MPLLLTPKAIDAAIKRSESGPDETLADTDAKGAGRLLLRARKGFATWQFRYSPAPYKDDKYPMGQYARTAGKGGLTLAEARAKAAEWAGLLKDPKTRNLRAHFDGIEQAHRDAEQATRDAAEAAEREATEASRFTLAALLGIYTDHLRAQKKVSAGKVAVTIRRHILTDRPALSGKLARDVDRRDVAGVVREIMEAGSVRTAGHLRGYLFSAYRLAIGAEGDPTAPAALIPFGIERNPVEGVKALQAATRDRTLTPAELRLALGRMAASDSVCAHLLRACVMGGGQRPQQMARARVGDYDATEGALELWDGKGRRKVPRSHVLPLGPETQAHIAAMVERARKLGTDYLFTDVGGEPVQVGSVSHWVGRLVADMLNAREVSAPFQAKDLRRTAETMQARNGFGKDLRAQLLSHGLGGVQSARYDRHDYFKEKREALERWEALLKAPVPGANVVPMTRRTG